MSRLSLLAATGAAGLALLAGPANASQSLGFAVSWFMPNHYFSDQDCPEGLNEELNWEPLLGKVGVSKAEYQELIKPENTGKLLMRIMHRGPNGENVCLEPWVDKHSPDWKPVKGKIAYGENLDGTTDGRATETTCAHEKFTTPEGQKVDNQFYRLWGCSKGWRGPGKTGLGQAYIIDRMREGTMTQLIEITGIDDLKNDPEIEFIFYRGIEPLKKDASGEVMANHTFHVMSDPGFQIKMKGSIKNGEITTEPRDFELVIGRLWQPPYVRWKSARFRVKIDETNGMLKGTMAGYRDVALEYFAAQKVKPLAEKQSGMNCPGFYRALKKLADGDRDPVTGECRSISAIDNIEAVPAFLIHPEDTKTTETARPVRNSEARP